MSVRLRQMFLPPADAPHMIQVHAVFVLRRMQYQIYERNQGKRFPLSPFTNKETHFLTVHEAITRRVDGEDVALWLRFN